MHTKRFKALLFRHGAIQQQIEEEQRGPRPDPIRLFRLKRLRLALKDSMRKLVRALEMESERVRPRPRPLRPRLTFSLGQRGRGTCAGSFRPLCSSTRRTPSLSVS